MGGVGTSFSDLCCQWTNVTVPAAKSEVPRRVSFEARDMVAVGGGSRSGGWVGVIAVGEPVFLEVTAAVASSVQW